MDIDNPVQGNEAVVDFDKAGLTDAGQLYTEEIERFCTANLQAIRKQGVTIEALTLTGSRASCGLPHFAELKDTVTRLVVRDTYRVQAEQLAKIDAYEQVKSLHLGVNTLDMSAMPVMRSVEELHIDDSVLKSDGWSLDSFPALRRLFMGSPNAILSEVLLSSFQSSPNLEELRITPGHVSEEGNQNGYYEFAHTLKAMDTIQLINGVPRAEWDPGVGIEGFDNKMDYLVKDMAHKLAVVIADAGFTLVRGAPSIKGKLLVASIEDDAPLAMEINRYPLKKNTAGAYLNGSTTAGGSILPDDRYAESFEACDTLAVLLVSSEYVGLYTNGTEAYGRTYNLQVYDLRNRLKYEPFYLGKADPPNLIKDVGSGSDAFSGRLTLQEIYSPIMELLTPLT